MANENIISLLIIGAIVAFFIFNPLQKIGTQSVIGEFPIVYVKNAYNPDMSIGGLGLDAGSLQGECADVSFDSTSETLCLGEAEKPFGKFVRIKLIDVRNPTKVDWQYTLSIDFTDEDFITLKNIDTQTLLRIDDKHDIPFTIRTNWTSFEGGITVLHEGLVQSPPTIDRDLKELSIPSGENQDEVPLIGTHKLGLIRTTMQPFIKIQVPFTTFDMKGGGVDPESINTVYNEVRLLDDNKAVKIYNVVANVPFLLDNSVDCTSKACPSGFSCNSYLFQNQVHNICEKGQAILQLEQSQQIKPRGISIVGLDASIIVLLILGVILFVVIIMGKQK